MDCGVGWGPEPLSCCLPTGSGVAGDPGVPCIRDEGLCRQDDGKPLSKELNQVSF